LLYHFAFTNDEMSSTRNDNDFNNFIVQLLTSRKYNSIK